jgi:hypothetical protein
MKSMILKSIIFSILLTLIFRSCSYAQASSGEKCQPVKIAVLQDLTGSVHSNDVPILQMGDVEALIKILHRCGGELGFGSISENSNKRLARLIIETPPIEPIEPDKKGNPYKAARLHSEYKEQLTKYQALNAEWTQRNKADIDKFKKDVQKILRGRVAHRSDIWSAVKRADFFLSEDNSAWQTDIQLYVIFITDGDDNVGGKKISNFNKQTKTIIVPGSVGVLAVLKPLKFENICSALRFLNTQSSKRSK